MLSSLHIENMAVIRRLDFEPGSGFSVLTGETGAGKSIIIDSINFLLCCRTSRELIRSGESRAVVSATFTGFNSDETAALAALGVGIENGELTMQRTLSSDSRSVCRIDGRSVSQAIFREVGRLLISVHGQNDSQRLTDPALQTAVIDTLAHNNAVLADYRKLWGEYRALLNRIAELQKSEAEKYQLRDMLEYQIKDISSHKLKAGEEEALSAERKKLQSLELIKKQTDVASKALCHNDRGITASYLAGKAADALARISDVVPEYAALSRRLVNCKYELDDIAAELNSGTSAAGIDGDPTERLDRIESRLETISRLKRKYGQTVEEIIQFGENAQKRLDDIEDADDVCAGLRKKADELLAALEASASVIGKTRRQAAGRIENEIASILRYLDMPKVRFAVCIGDAGQLGESGRDKIDFMLSANQGEEPMPLSRVASGGELSRVMLALKCAVAGADGIQTLIFDEIDSGVSGKTSRKIGLKLREASKTAQVICVTHSAQIASLADTHVLISKSEVNGRTETSVAVLDGEGRINETARILGGLNVTSAQRQAAVDMINERNTDCGG